MVITVLCFIQLLFVVGYSSQEKFCFRHATCWLPEYNWEDVYEFTPEDVSRFEEIIRSTAHLILEFSQEEGGENASGLEDRVLLGLLLGERRKTSNYRLRVHFQAPGPCSCARTVEPALPEPDVHVQLHRK